MFPNGCRRCVGINWLKQKKGRLKTYISGFQTTFLLLKRLTAQSVMTDVDGFLFVARIGDKDDFFIHFADGFHVFARVVQLMQEVADTVEAGAFFCRRNG